MNEQNACMGFNRMIVLCLNNQPEHVEGRNSAFACLKILIKLFQIN